MWDVISYPCSVSLLQWFNQWFYPIFDVGHYWFLILNSTRVSQEILKLFYVGCHKCAADNSCVFFQVPHVRLSGWLWTASWHYKKTPFVRCWESGDHLQASGGRIRCSSKQHLGLELPINRLLGHIKECSVYPAVLEWPERIFQNSRHSEDLEFTWCPFWKNWSEATLFPRGPLLTSHVRLGSVHLAPDWRGSWTNSHPFSWPEMLTHVHFRMTSLTCAIPRALSECWLGIDVQILCGFINFYWFWIAYQLWRIYIVFVPRGIVQLISFYIFPWYKSLLSITEQTWDNKYVFLRSYFIIYA